MNRVHKRRLAVAAAGLLAVLLVAGWLLVLRGPQAPADGAAALVPADALVYLHLSTAEGRDEDERFAETLSKFPLYNRLRTGLELLVASRSGGFELERDVRSWLGDEAAIALLDTGTSAANSLLLLSVADEDKAQGVLTRAAGASGAVRYRGAVIRRFGSVAAAFAGGFLALGQEASVRAAIDRAAGRGRALATDPAYVAATGRRDAARTLDAYASPDGVRRVLAAQPGLAGAIGRLLDHPKLRGVSLSASAEDPGLRLRVRQVKRPNAARTFEPALLKSVPDTAAAYLGLGGLDAISSLLPNAGAEALLDRLRKALPADGGVNLDRDVLGPLRGEIALSVTPALPTPIITLVARTSDESRTREALGRLQGVLADTLGAAAEQSGSIPTFEERDLGDGVTAYALQLTPSFELLYAVFDGRVVLSTAAAGIQRVKDGGGALEDEESFERTVNRRPERTEALLFADLRQLLTLGDEAGFSDVPAYRTARDTLRRISAVGAVATREGNDTEAEFLLEIP